MSYYRYLILFLGGHPEDAVKLIHSITRTILTISSLILGIFGFSGNILAIKILRRRLLRDNAMSIYLIWLAAMNICCLVVEISRFFIMGLLDFNYREYNYEVCIIHRWCTIVTITVCNWFLVLITLARWLLLRYPIRSACLLKKTKIHILIVSFIFSAAIIQGFGLLLFAGFDFWGSMQARQHFARHLCRLHAASIAVIVTRLWVSVIPLVVLALLSFLIFYQVKSGVKGATFHLSSATLNRRAARERTLAILLLLSNFQFMITNLPLGIYYLTAHKFFNESSKVERALSDMAANAARLSLYGGYATNCILYCFFGSRFRSELIKFLFENGICRKHLRRESTFPVFGLQTTRSAYPSAIDPKNRQVTASLAVVSRLSETEVACTDTASYVPSSCDGRLAASMLRSSSVDPRKSDLKR